VKLLSKQKWNLVSVMTNRYLEPAGSVCSLVINRDCDQPENVAS
jgi:hypothetical protein